MLKFLSKDTSDLHLVAVISGGIFFVLTVSAIFLISRIFPQIENMLMSTSKIFFFFLIGQLLLGLCWTLIIHHWPGRMNQQKGFLIGFLLGLTLNLVVIIHSILFYGSEMNWKLAMVCTLSMSLIGGMVGMVDVSLLKYKTPTIR